MSAFREGVFFSMPEDEYFSVPALSASGVKWLRQSPLDYWARQPWLGQTEDSETEEESFARTLGKAYHARILEGREVFNARYCGELEPFEGMLKTDDDLRLWLAANDLSTGGKRKQDRIDRILDAAPHMASRIWDCALEDYTQTHAGKIFIKQKYLDKIDLAAAMIEKSPTLGNAFKGGIPEVSIFWVDEETGCPCKARLDYWKPRAIVDLKTISEEHGREFGRAVDREFANRRYGAQGTWYWQAAQAGIAHMKAGRLYGSAPLAITEKIISTPKDERKLLWVFQQKGPAPLAMGKIYNPESAVFKVWEVHLEAARRTYVEHMEKFGRDPWITDYPITEFEDSEVPIWATE